MHFLNFMFYFIYYTKQKDKIYKYITNEVYREKNKNFSIKIFNLMI